MSEFHEVELSDGRVLEFPVSMDRRAIQEAVMAFMGTTVKPPPQRQAETESTTKFEAAEREPVLPGWVAPSMIGISAVGGAAAGAPAGPAGVMAGGGLGAAGGSLLSDLAETWARKLSDKPPMPELTGTGPAKRALGEAALDVGTAGAAPYVMPALRAGGARLLGVADPAIKRMSEAAERQGVGLGITHVSERKTVKGAAPVLGIFPFVGTPLRRGQERVVGELDARAASLLNELAPTSDRFDVSRQLAGKASARYAAFNRVSSALYENFEKLADDLPYQKIVNTTPIKDAVSALAQREAREAVPTAIRDEMGRFGKGEVKLPGKDEIGDYLKQLASLPDRLTVAQARGLERQLNELYRRGASENWDVSRLGLVKKGLENAKDSLDMPPDLVPPEQAAAVRQAWDRANAFFRETKPTFETQTAKRFGRLDKRMFAAGAEKPGTSNVDEVFKDVFQSGSLEAMRDLKAIVGPNAFRSASRQYLDEAFRGAMVPAKEGGLVGEMFSPAVFKNRLKLDAPEGRRAMSEMLRGSGLDVADWLEFLKVAEKAGDIVVRDPSSFLSRRLVLGGGIASGLAIGLRPDVGIPSAVLVTLATRGGASFLMNPANLKSLTSALRPNATDAQKIGMLVRLTTTSIRGTENR